jgi:hypothetical protein
MKGIKSRYLKKNIYLIGKTCRPRNTHPKNKSRPEKVAQKAKVAQKKDNIRETFQSVGEKRQTEEWEECEDSIPFETFSNF